MKIPRLFGAIVLSCALVATASAAADYYLKIQGVPGESSKAKKGSDKSISIESFSWGATNTSHREAGSAQASGRRSGSVIFIGRDGAEIWKQALADKTVFPSIEVGEGKKITTLTNVACTKIEQKGGKNIVTLSFEDATTRSTESATPADRTR